MTLADLAPGLPIPCRDDPQEDWIDLNAALVPNPLSTFFMRVSGEGLRSRGIHGGDLVVIDRSLEPATDQVVVTPHRGRFILRVVARLGEQWLLLPNRDTDTAIPIDLADFEHSALFGVVAHVVHHLTGAPSRRR